MIRTTYLIFYSTCLDALPKAGGHQEIIYSPSLVVLPQRRYLLIPEGERTPSLRMQIPERIHPPLAQGQPEVCPLCVHEPRDLVSELVRLVDVGVFHCHIEIPTHDRWLSGLEATNPRPEHRIPRFHPIPVPLGYRVLTVRGVYRNQVERCELYRRDPTLTIKRGRLDFSHQALTRLNPDACPAEPLSLSSTIRAPPEAFRIHLRNPIWQFDFGLLRLGLLDTYNIRSVSHEEVQSAFS